MSELGEITIQINYDKISKIFKMDKSLFLGKKIHDLIELNIQNETKTYKIKAGSTNTGTSLLKSYTGYGYKYIKSNKPQKSLRIHSSLIQQDISSLSLVQI